MAIFHRLCILFIQKIFSFFIILSTKLDDLKNFYNKRSENRIVVSILSFAIGAFFAIFFIPFPEGISISLLISLLCHGFFLHIVEFDFISFV